MKNKTTSSPRPARAAGSATPKIEKKSPSNTATNTARKQTFEAGMKSRAMSERIFGGRREKLPGATLRSPEMMPANLAPKSSPRTVPNPKALAPKSSPRTVPSPRKKTQKQKPYPGYTRLNYPA